MDLSERSPSWVVKERVCVGAEEGASGAQIVPLLNGDVTLIGGKKIVCLDEKNSFVELILGMDSKSK